jgi:thymidylate synthase (FAD)
MNSKVAASTSMLFGLNLIEID